MKIEEHSTRTFSIELTEEEAKQLRSVLSWYPTNIREDYRDEAREFADSLDDKLCIAGAERNARMQTIEQDY